MSKYGVIFGPHFPEFGLNAEIYGVDLRIQSEYMKIRARNNSVFGHFLRSKSLGFYFIWCLQLLYLHITLWNYHTAVNLIFENKPDLRQEPIFYLMDIIKIFRPSSC